MRRSVANAFVALALLPERHSAIEDRSDTERARRCSPTRPPIFGKAVRSTILARLYLKTPTPRGDFPLWAPRLGLGAPEGQHQAQPMSQCCQRRPLPLRPRAADVADPGARTIPRPTRPGSRILQPGDRQASDDDRAMALQMLRALGACRRLITAVSKSNRPRLGTWSRRFFPRRAHIVDADLDQPVAGPAATAHNGRSSGPSPSARPRLVVP